MKKDFLISPNPTQWRVEKPQSQSVVAYVSSNFVHGPDWQTRTIKPPFGGLVYFYMSVIETAMNRQSDNFAKEEKEADHFSEIKHN